MAQNEVQVKLFTTVEQRNDGVHQSDTLDQNASKTTQNSKGAVVKISIEDHKKSAKSIKTLGIPNRSKRSRSNIVYFFKRSRLSIEKPRNSGAGCGLLDQCTLGNIFCVSEQDLEYCQT